VFFWALFCLFVLKPADNWGVDAERLSIELYARILCVTVGLEPPPMGEEITTKG
jgi:hypothetical protein